MKKVKPLLDVISDFVSLIYPNECLCCQTPLMKQERIICTDCEIHLPRTNYHREEGNEIEKIFWGRVKIEKASSYFLFKKGSKYQKLMHNLKYKGEYGIGVYLGRKYGLELCEANYFSDVDLIIPVPLHAKKLKKRGYNQSMAIAEGLSFGLKCEIGNDILVRTVFSETQTRKGRFERWENMQSIFEITNCKFIEGKHILLVDDIVTTGSTLEACAQVLLAVKDVKVSIATIAFASN